MNVTLIPGLMRSRHRWQVAPVLMEEWLGRSQSDHRPDTRTVRMDWLLRFPRAREVYDGIVQGRAWLSEDGRRGIVGWLASQHLLTGREEGFGAPDFGTAGTERLEQDTVLTRPVGSLVGDPVDDMYGALGRFDFRVLVAGTVRPGGSSGITAPTATLSARPRTLGTFTVRIDRVGVFAWDTYDFTTHQVLGHWGSRGMSLFQVDGDWVTNGDFRDYQRRTGHGGDYWIYSDVRTIRLATPDTFTFAG